MYFNEGFVLHDNPETSNQPTCEIDVDSPVNTLALINDFTRMFYAPMRGGEGYGTERATVVAPQHVPHRENNAEHSWHLASLAFMLHGNRDRLGISFPLGFNIGLAVTLAIHHDISEVVVPDVDSVDPNEQKRADKSLAEFLGMHALKNKLPYMRSTIQNWETYDRKDTPEAIFVNDLDKIAGTVVIANDGGKKWHYWRQDEKSGGYSTSREYMNDCLQPKFKSAFGRKLHETVNAYLDEHPSLFPETDPRTQDPDQGRLFIIP